MSVDLLQQLRDYGTWHEDTQHHVVAGDVIDATRPIPPLQPPRSTPVWRGVGIAVAVGFALVALMALPLLLLFSGDDAPPATTPESSTVTTEPPSPNAQAEGWARLDTAPEAFADTVPYRVVSFRSGFVAVGAAQTGSCDEVQDEEEAQDLGDDGGVAPPCRVATWYSPDGEQWQRTDLGAEPLPGIPWDLVATDSLVMAVGWQHDLSPEAWQPGGSGRAAVWISADGITWDAVQSDEFTAELDAKMRSVTVGGTGFVAAGSVTETDPDTQVPITRGAVWISTNALDWERVEDQRGVFTTSQIEAIQSTTVGFIAAGGPNGTVWHSNDGITWQLASEPEVAAQFGESYFIVESNGEVFLIGDKGGVWTTNDGATWTSLAARPSPFGEFYDIAVSDGTFIAVGSSDAGHGVWTSTDAVTWLPIHPIDGVFDQGVIFGITATDGGATVVGWRSVSPDGALPNTSEPGTTIGAVWHWQRRN